VIPPDRLGPAARARGGPGVRASRRVTHESKPGTVCGGRNPGPDVTAGRAPGRSSQPVSDQWFNLLSPFRFSVHFESEPETRTIIFSMILLGYPQAEYLPFPLRFRVRSIEFITKAGCVSQCNGPGSRAPAHGAMVTVTRIVGLVTVPVTGGPSPDAGPAAPIG
jgi:hypothetical protein